MDRGRDAQTAVSCFADLTDLLMDEPKSPKTASASRKEVIQPQVPLRLPCYDFTPVADLTVVGYPLFRLAHRLRVKPTPMV